MTHEIQLNSPTPDKPIELHVFHSTMQSVKYGFTDGSMAEFIRGRYYTDDPAKIAALQNEIRLRHPYLYVEAGKETVMSDDLDPVAVMRKQIRAELMLEMLAASGNPGRDMGSYSPGKLQATNTNDVANHTHGGDATMIQARIMQMAKEAGAQSEVGNVVDTIKQETGASSPSARLNALKTKGE
jgi:hypothetical protein